MRALAVNEPSEVFEARRRAVAIATTLGFNETEAGRVAIAATELATNLVKHARGGEFLIGAYDDETGGGVQLLALDRGPGMADVAACRRDGFSTAGSAGQGLGAIARQAQVFDIASWPGRGSAMLARISASSGQRGGQPAGSARPRCAGLSVPKPGEDVCGDAWAVVANGSLLTVLVADGLGHGPIAAEASLAAVRTFRADPGAPLAAVLEALHAALRPTRGAAVAVARIDPARAVVSFAGIGNIAGSVVGGAETRRMVSHNGTAGHVARRFQVFEYSAGPLVILHSDGLGSAWSLDPYPGLVRAHPALIAGVLYRDFARGRDDVTVVVASGGMP